MTCHFIMKNTGHIYLMVICGMRTQQRLPQKKRDHNWLLGWLWYKGSQIYMLTPIGVIIPVWFYVVLAWECFCLLSAQCIILFIIRVMLFDFYISYMFILCKQNWLHYNSIAVWDITDCVCLSLCIKSYCQVLFV